jgi:hypothetical protein
VSPDLDEVARDPEAGNVNRSRRNPKQKVQSRSACPRPDRASGMPLSASGFAA